MDEPTLNRTGPLAGLRVLDLTAVVLGPVATQTLGDFGADVVKVEPLEGDMMRANGTSKHPGMSSVFLAVNRNKRSLAIDLKSPAGVEAVRRLLPGFDVLIHNMREAAIERLGLGYESVRAINPRIVYCAATGFGRGGPCEAQPVFDDVIQAASGLASLSGQDTGRPDYVPSLIADKTAGLATANAVLAAMVHQARTGEGQFVEVPMFETMAAFMLIEHLGGLTFDPPLGPAGYARLLSGGRRPAPASDGHVAILPYTQAHWTRFFDGVGRPDLAAKYALGDRQELNARIGELYADMHAVTRSLSTEALIGLCLRLDIPATRLYSIDELPEHPHLRAVGLLQDVDHPTEGRIRAVRPAARFARTPAELALPAPTLGQHTVEVLHEAGLGAQDLAALVKAGAIGPR